MRELSLSTGGRVMQVGKLLCIGKNYALHAAEMKSTVPKQPLVFLKPASALVGTGGTVVLPEMSNEVHHEVELVVVIGQGGKDIPEEEALDHVFAYAVGLDMTARDLQLQAKKVGHPWSVAKGFDTFAPLGPLAAPQAVGDPQDLNIELKINGEVRQAAHTSAMVYPVAHLIAYCSRIFTLMPGDLLFTGTPEGVGPVHDGDVLEASVEGLPPLRVKVKRGER